MTFLVEMASIVTIAVLILGFSLRALIGVPIARCMGLPVFRQSMWSSRSAVCLRTLDNAMSILQSAPFKTGRARFEHGSKGGSDLYLLLFWKTYLLIESRISRCAADFMVQIWFWTALP